MTKVSKWRVGFWVTEKKAKKLSFNDFKEVCADYDIDLFQLDLEKDLESQGPTDAIVHKFTDVMAKADLDNDPQAISICRDLDLYFATHSNDFLVIDPLDKVRLLCDRFQQYTLIDSACKIDGVRTPAFVVVREELRSDELLKDLFAQAEVHFPVVCKPLVAHGQEAHKMALVFNEAHLADISPPYVAQTFIAHNAVLYKVYIIGSKHFVFPRPSLRNFVAGDYPTIFFDSHEVSKEGCSSDLSQQDGEHLGSVPKLNYEQVATAIADIRDRTGLSLFGLDIIVDPSNGLHYIIDANTFPSYDGIPNFFNLLAEYLSATLQERDRQRQLQPVPSASSSLAPLLIPDLAAMFPVALPLVKVTVSPPLKQEKEKTSARSTEDKFCCSFGEPVRMRPKRPNRKAFCKGSNSMDGKLASSEAPLGSAGSRSSVVPLLSPTLADSTDGFLSIDEVGRRSAAKNSRPASVGSSPKVNKRKHQLQSQNAASDDCNLTQRKISPGRPTKHRSASTVDPPGYKLEAASLAELASDYNTKYEKESGALSNNSGNSSSLAMRSPLFALPSVQQAASLSISTRLPSMTPILADAVGIATATRFGPDAFSTSGIDSGFYSDSSGHITMPSDSDSSDCEKRLRELKLHPHGRGIKDFYGIPKPKPKEQRSDTLP